MRKVVLLFVFLSGFAFGQIPSINENYSSYSKNIVGDSKIQEELIQYKKEELKRLEEEYEKKISLLDDKITLKKEGLDEFVNNEKLTEKIENSIKNYLDSVVLLTHKKDSLSQNYLKSIESKEEEIKEKEIETVMKLANKKQYELKLKEINDKIEEYKNEISSKNLKLNRFFKLKKELEKLRALKNELTDTKKDYQNNFKPHTGWLPSTNKLFKEYFFETHYSNSIEHTNFLNSLTLLRNNNSNTISSELLTDNLAFLRISFGTVVAFSDEEDTLTEETEKDLEKLLNGGGNFYLDFTLPVYTNYYKDFFSYYNYINLKTATDIKGFDSDIDDTSANFSLGFSQYFGTTSDNNKFNFALSTSSNLHYGLKDFRQNLDLSNEIFFNTNVSFFVTLDNKFRIALRTNFASEPSIRTEKIAFGLQLLK